MANQTCNPQIVTQALGIQATGPRTVIVPADPIIWDERTSYEYLTLVASTDFGQGYVSKKDVPSGTPLTNTDYWIPVASYNAQLSQIQQQMGQISQSVDQIETDLENKAPVNHASEDTTYGTGSNENYGHVKLSDSPSDTDQSNGIAATPKMVNDVIAGRNYRFITEYGCSTELDDNSTYFQNALNDCAGKYELIIPNGEFKFTNTVYIPWYTTLRGVNIDKSVLYFINCHGLSVGNDINNYPTAVGCDISFFTIKGNFAYNFWNQPSTPAYNGINGWFTMSKIHDLYIHHFYRGVSINQPAFAGNDYNVKYNNKYGDNRVIDNLCVQWGIYGIFMTSSDWLINNIDIAHMGYEAMRAIASHISNVHVWDVPCIYLQDGCVATSIEIEAVNPLWNPFNGIFDVFESPISFDPRGRGIAVSGLHIWNINRDFQTNDVFNKITYNHPYMRCLDGSTGTLVASDITIGHDPGHTDAVKSLFEAHDAVNCSISGCISPAITSYTNLKGSRNFISDSEKALINFSGNSALSSHLNQFGTLSKYTVS